MSSDKKYCQEPGCGKPLRSHNAIGFCRTHRHKSPEMQQYFSNRHQTGRNRPYDSERYQQNRGQILAANRRAAWKRMGLDPDAILVVQADHDGLCDICGQPSMVMRGETPVPLVMDHDHATVTFRGFLCSPCNTMLGQARDNVDILVAAIEYLKRGGGKA